MKQRAPLTRRTPLSRRKALQSSGPLARTDKSPVRPAASRGRARSPFAASKRQRQKIDKLGACLVCGAQSWETTIDPAHLCARAQGGCDSRYCVVPLCRLCHTMFDEGRLDLLPYLRPAGNVLRWLPEIIHALVHYKGDLIGLLHRLTNARWVDVDGPEPVFDA